MLPNCSVAAAGSVICTHWLPWIVCHFICPMVGVRTLYGACWYIIVDVPSNVRRDHSSTDDLAGLEALLDTCVIVLVGTPTLSYLCRMNTCLVDSDVSLNPLGLLWINRFIMNKHTYQQQHDTHTANIMFISANRPASAAVLAGPVFACSLNNQNCQRRRSYNVSSRCLISGGSTHDVLPTNLPPRSVTLRTRPWCYTMRTRSGSDYAHDTTPYCSSSQSTMEMDALNAAITSLDVTGPLTTEHLAQLLRGLAKTITGKFDLLIAKNNSEIKALNTKVSELEEKCDELEQYSRRNVIRIRGIPEKAGEETDAVVQELAETKLDVKIAAHDIVRSHRVGGRGRQGDTARCHRLFHHPQHQEGHHAKRPDTQGFSDLH